MAIQGILFIVGIVLLVAAVLCAAGAAWLFFRKNIPDIRADLTGKKRAKIIAEMSERDLAVKRREAPAPSSAAAEAAASVAKRAAKKSDLEEVQITAGPKPKEPKVDLVDASTDTVEPEDIATTIEAGGDDTIIEVENVAVEEGVTTVEGIDASAMPWDTSQMRANGLASMGIVKKIVLTDSAEYIRIGRQGKGNE